MSDVSTRVNLLPMTTTNAAQSVVYENEYVDSAEFELNIVSHLSASLSLLIEGIQNDGTAYTIFQGPAETTNGVKRYGIFYGDVNSTTDKNALIPAKIRATVTPVTPGNDQYSLAATVYCL